MTIEELEAVLIMGGYVRSSLDGMRNTCTNVLHYRALLQPLLNLRIPPNGDHN